jgi:hypothetical protein
MYFTFGGDGSIFYLIFSALSLSPPPTVPTMQPPPTRSPPQEMTPLKSVALEMPEAAPESPQTGAEWMFENVYAYWDSREEFVATTTQAVKDHTAGHCMLSSLGPTVEAGLYTLFNVCALLHAVAWGLNGAAIDLCSMSIAPIRHICSCCMCTIAIIPLAIVQGGCAMWWATIFTLSACISLVSLVLFGITWVVGNILAFVCV